ncbi:MAG: glutamate synthase subunit beta [Phycisphaerae bacterium]|nr:glutamate synthase subunit beta [Phycisphaerae bacterium]
MTDKSGFLKYNRVDVSYRPVAQRLTDFQEVSVPLALETLLEQAARCMDCGIPFCLGTGCPLKNKIPDWNRFVYNGMWLEACQLLHSTNNFPEITGRVCPAPCETACCLGISASAVNIKHIEYKIVERGFAEGWIKPLIPETRSGKEIAIIGSGPAGLAAAQQLARFGHTPVVFEKDSRIGGLLRYGIPDFKLDKNVLDRRLQQLKAEGVRFETGVQVGEDISPKYLEKVFDAVCLTIGAGQPRDIEIPGRRLDGVHFAMDFLSQQNKICAGDIIPDDQVITAKGKHVVVIGGGDTGSDCVGTSRRQGAVQVHQLEIMPIPPVSRPDSTPWPNWPNIMRTSSSHEEGCNRRWSVTTKELIGANGKVTELHGIEVKWQQKDGRWNMVEVPGTEFTIKADLILLAMGFVHVAHKGLVEKADLKVDQRGNIAIDENFMTSRKGFFAAGDSHNGASLVVTAIDFGRKAANAIDNFLEK